MIADLHIHTRNSDGSLDVEEIFYIASKTQINAIAITDHNFFNSRQELLKLSGLYGVDVVFGVEISCFDPARQRKVHVLCYNAADESVLAPVCEKAFKIRVELGKQKANFVMNNYPISNNLINKYKSRSGCVYQQNLTHALMHCGYCSSIYGTVYDSLSSESLNLSVENDCDVRKVLKLIRKAGGKSIMAHPFVYNSFELLNELIDEKLIDGAEVWHPKNSEQEKQLLLNLLQKNNLIATGGTDFHGLYSSIYLSKLGSFHTPEVYFKKLKSKAQV